MQTKEYWKKRYTLNKEEMKKIHHDWYKKNRTKELSRANKYRLDHLKEIKIHNKKVKLLVLNHYSNNDPKCVCCGEKILEFLSIDHINGDGHKHRKQIAKRAGNSFYCWLIKNNFPVDPPLQVLCFNCNQAKGHLGFCPHEKIQYTKKTSQETKKCTNL